MEHHEKAAATAASDHFSMGSLVIELQDIVSDMLGTEVAMDQPLMEAGLDSLSELQWTLRPFATKACIRGAAFDVYPNLLLGLSQVLWSCGT